MYQIENKSDIFVEHYTGWRKIYTIDRIGDEKDLIKYLAEGFHRWNIYTNEWVNNDYHYNPCFDEHFFDGYGRDIIASIYKYDAWVYFCTYLRNTEQTGKKSYSYWRKNKVYKGTFRKEPVEGIHHYGGGPSVRPRKIKHIKAMYANPEYKDFNRGSKKEVPCGWWDDWHRCTEKNWKSQRKSRHQWKGDV